MNHCQTMKKLKSKTWFTYWTGNLILFVFNTKSYTWLRFTSVPSVPPNEINYLYFARFSISLEGYHEMSQAVGGKDLSRSYIVEGCQASLDSLWDIQRSPGKAPGAELSFKQLLKLQLQRNVKYLQSSINCSRQWDCWQTEGDHKRFQTFPSISKIPLPA